MAINLNNLSLQQLKAELTQKGLEVTGKKSELVERLKKAIESDGSDMFSNVVDTTDPVSGVDKSEEQMEDVEMSEGEGADGEKSEESHSKSKRWLHVVAGKKISSKIKHFDVVQKMSFKRKKKDIQTAVIQHRIRVFPLEPSDLGHPEMVELMKKCSSTTMSFVCKPEDDGDRELKGLLVLNFQKQADALESINFFKQFRDGLEIHHPTLGVDFGEYQEKWNMLHQGVPEQAEKFLMLLPHIPEELGESDVWNMFPSAREIYICPKTKATIKYAGKNVERDQPAYAYIQFPNWESSQTDLENLTKVTPTEEMRKMCLVPITKMIEWAKEDSDKAARKKASNGTPSSQASATTKGQGVSPKPKKSLGVVATARGVRQNRPNYNQRSYGPQSSYQHQRGMMSLMDDDQMGMMGPQQRSLLGARPNSAPLGRMIDQLESVAATRGPEEAQGVRLLGEMLSSMGTGSRGHGQWQSDQVGPYGKRSAGRGNFLQGGRQGQGNFVAPMRGRGGKRMRPDTMSYGHQGGYYDEDDMYSPADPIAIRARRSGEYSGNRYDSYDDDIRYGGSGYGGTGYVYP